MLKIRYAENMKTSLVVNARGTITLPAKFRRQLGIKANDVLIAEVTSEGLLLRPSVALPLEIYTKERVAEFAVAESELENWYKDRASKLDASEGSNPAPVS